MLRNWKYPLQVVFAILIAIFDLWSWQNMRPGQKVRYSLGNLEHYAYLCLDNA